MALGGTTYASGWQEWAQVNPRAHALYNKVTPTARGWGGSIKGYAGIAGAKFAGANARLQQSVMGRALSRGLKESAGFYYDATGKSHGFLGIRSTLEEIRTGKSLSGKAFFSSNAQMRHALSGSARTSQSGFSTIFGQTGTVATPGSKVLSASGVAKFAGKTLMKGLGGIVTGYFAYSAYKKEGISGAAREVAYGAAGFAAINLLGLAIGSVATGGLALVGAAALGYGYALTKGADYSKRLSELEMGGGDRIMQAIRSEGATTARQRSVMALQNTHINGRMAMGNEASLMHIPFR